MRRLVTLPSKRRERLPRRTILISIMRLQVAENSLGLFDVTRALHGLGDWERVLLHAAALMHDTGYENRPDQHHKGSRDLILESGLDEFSVRELMMIACVARYHRKAVPHPKHGVYQELDEADRGVVERLSALIRIGDWVGSHPRRIDAERPPRTDDGGHPFSREAAAAQRDGYLGRQAQARLVRADVRVDSGYCGGIVGKGSCVCPRASVLLVNPNRMMPPIALGRVGVCGERFWRGVDTSR